ncbi:hypothetical protein A0U89_14825 (plasmid) [Kozakia baliensis]|uniref:Uncharacterized protein n=1 Tax=Kozakia baliensis TaxID=153496 RepID=A0A1D8UY62_9PROT|nr:hypothetical protein A0U89_14825 [Kozakia baliensis]
MGQIGRVQGHALFVAENAVSTERHEQFFVMIQFSVGTGQSIGGLDERVNAFVKSGANGLSSLLQIQIVSGSKVTGNRVL